MKAIKRLINDAWDRGNFESASEAIDELKAAETRVHELEAAETRVHELEAERDQAWQELREIREAIGADENESTANEVLRIMNAAKKFSAAHSNCTDYDGDALPCCDPQDWAEFDLAFGIEAES